MSCRGSLLKLAYPAARSACAQESCTFLWVLGVTATLSQEDLGAASLFPQMAPMSFLSSCICCLEIGRPRVVDLLEVLFGLVTLVRSLAKAQLAELHLGLDAAFGGVG